MKLDFSCDYLEGAHPLVLNRLVETNLEKTAGYGLDAYCEHAKEAIRSACGCPRADVFFLCGGTQTNATVIDALLHPYQGILAAESGHICTHESGAIETGGHKILSLPQHLGKLDPDELAAYFAAYYSDVNREHMVMPGAVYLSHPTEYGTLYTQQELEQIRAICHHYHALVYLDGARLAYGLAAYGTDVTLQTLARNCDVFYIGGTKCGALFGEAVVIPKAGMIPHFFSIIKQHGALFAKGRLLGLQFDALFSDNLYWRLGRHAVDMAEQLKAVLLKQGYLLCPATATNQQFVRLENEQMEQLRHYVGFSFWEPSDDAHTVVRFATNWATQQSDIDALQQVLLTM